MTITQDFYILAENFEQAEIALKYRDIFITLSNKIKSIDRELEQVTNDVKFTNIPVDIKQAMNSYWQLIKDFNASIAADDQILELLTWSTQSAPPE